MRPALTRPLLNNSLVALLVLIVIMVFVIPFVSAPDNPVGLAIQEILFSLVLLNGVVIFMHRHRGFLLTLAVLFAVLAIGVRWLGWVFPSTFTVELRDGITLLALALISGTTGIKVFAAGAVTLDRISGAVALYILMGSVWAQAYQLIILSNPGAFSGDTLVGTTAESSTWIYFSFVTLTTVGYGDILPVARAARSLANIEALIGQLYPAIVLARLVSSMVARGDSDTNS
jgi:hypothetical protein